MSNNLKERVLIVGAGQMAIDYFNVLKDLNCDIFVVGRGEKSANNFRDKTGVLPYIGGLANYLTTESVSFSKAIVAVGVECLKETTIQLVDKSIKSILVEKPAGLNLEEIVLLSNYSHEKKSDIFVAYNRRFYLSVLKAKEIIAEDGGVTSFNFEFTEWSHIIEKLEKASGVKENWFMGNSTHVVDLAFYLGGRPKEISCYKTGSLDWHPKASVFSGAGISEGGALFNYQANWEAPGRWSVEVLTKKHRLILRPMEKLQIQNIGSVAVEMVEIDYTLDTKYKAGLFKQTEAFLNNEKINFCMIGHQAKNAEVYNKISGY